MCYKYGLSLIETSLENVKSEFKEISATFLICLTNSAGVYLPEIVYVLLL